MKNVTLKLMVPILGLVLILAGTTLYASDTGIDHKAPTEVVYADALASNPIQLESKEHYKLDDAEYTTAVASKSEMKYESILLFGAFALLAIMLFARFTNAYRRMTYRGKLVFNSLAFALAVVAAYILPPAAPAVLAWVLPAGKTFDQVIKGFKEERVAKAKQMQDMLDKAMKEERELNEEEQKKYDKLKGERSQIAEQLALAEEAYAEERMKPAVPIPGPHADDNVSDKDKKDFEKYNFMRAIQSRIPDSGVALDGIEAEMHQEAHREATRSGIKLMGFGVPNILLSKRTLGKPVYKRDLTATGQTSTAGDQGGDLVQTTKMGFIDVFRNRLVLASLGTRFLTGLQGNISMPRKTSVVDGAHKTENAQADEGTILFDSVDMSPKRLPFLVEYSKQLLLQSSIDVANMVQDDVIKGLAVKMENACINGSGSPAVTGLLNTSGIGSVVGGANGAAPDRDDIIDLETEVSIDNADIGSLAYLTNTKVRGVLKKTKTDSGSGIFVWQGGNELNGYPVGVTNNVPSDLDKGTSTGVCSAIIFGNWNEMVIGQWGGLDVMVNPYSKDDYGLIRLTASLYYDMQVTHAQAFSAMKDALAG